MAFEMVGQLKKIIGSNYSDLTRPIFPKWWFSKGNPRKFQGNRSVGEILFHLATPDLAISGLGNTRQGQQNTLQFYVGAWWCTLIAAPGSYVFLWRSMTSHLLFLSFAFLLPPVIVAGILAGISTRTIYPSALKGTTAQSARFHAGRTTATMELCWTSPTIRLGYSDLNFWLSLLHF